MAAGQIKIIHKEMEIMWKRCGISRFFGQYGELNGLKIIVEPSDPHRPNSPKEARNGMMMALRSSMRYHPSNLEYNDVETETISQEVIIGVFRNIMIIEPILADPYLVA